MDNNEADTNAPQPGGNNNTSGAYWRSVGIATGVAIPVTYFWGWEAGTTTFTVILSVLKSVPDKRHEL